MTGQVFSGKAARTRTYVVGQLTLVILVLVQAALLSDLDVINGINHLLGHAVLNNVVAAAVRQGDHFGAQLQALVGCVDGHIATARDGHTLALHSRHKSNTDILRLACHSVSSSQTLGTLYPEMPLNTQRSAEM